jgi:hypothetical protein
MASWDEKRRIRMKDQPKKPYVKPEVTQVPLRPEEAVLGNCKISGVMGPNSGNCGVIMCSTVGS